MEEVLSFLESLEDDRQQWKIAHSLKDTIDQIVTYTGLTAQQIEKL
ncbi:hypothetical protein FACS1894109_18690 [Spirochaetia bacterium]|nr:hypothetical protein FACS1894109_18690 [Spirochaetia bacterium]GHU16366.1 hypothetical protein FACS1894163_05600 [Spirochaetia bacterium]